MAHPITVRQVRKSFGDFVALHGIDLDIEAGEFLTLLGPSGSGKTTLLMSFAGFIRPEQGSIRVGDEEILTKPPHKREIGMVFQNYALFPHMSVGQNVAYPMKLRKVPKAEREKRVREALDLVQLKGLVDREVGQLSGGQRQRVALARAIVFEPRILLMDEPLSALDKKLREEMQIELKYLHRRLGMTTVYVTHDQREALTMSDRVAVMQNGEIKQIANPESLYEYPADRFVAGFVGESRFVPIQWSDKGVPILGGKPIKVDRELDFNSGDAALLMRPEKVTFLGSDYDSQKWNVIDGEIREIVYQGETVLINVQMSTGDTVDIRKSTGHGVLSSLPISGEKVRMGLHCEDVIIVRNDQR